MSTLKEWIIDLLERHRDGPTDREITDLVLGRGKPQQAVNIACRGLEKGGLVRRHLRADGLIGNYLAGHAPPPSVPVSDEKGLPRPGDGLSEDVVKKTLAEWLERQGWTVQVAWGKARGIDIDATKEGHRWIIEAKGCGSRPEMRVNYFLGMLGETLQRMSDPDARYSIALPDMAQFRRLWQRLPAVAKQRTGISALFVDEDGKVIQDE